MIKIKLGQLEIVRQNPIAYKNSYGSSSGIRSWGYFNALREGIRLFHKSGDNESQAVQYLANLLQRFKSDSKIEDTLEEFQWYVGNYFDRSWPTSEVFHNIVVPTDHDPLMVKCSGEISRLDIVPSGGYCAWVFHSDKADNWKSELRMPIIQKITGDILGVPISEVKVGVISFKEKYSDYCSYIQEEINDSFSELNSIVSQVVND
jgi:hypothetical protein